MRFEKGRPTPLETSEKVMLGLKQAAAKNPDWADCAAWVKSLSVDSSSQTPLDGGKERINATGTCTIGFKCLKRDVILNSKNYQFSIAMSDSRDEWGLPDVAVDSWSFKALG